MSTAYCFDRFEVQPVERRLLVDGQPAPIGARAFDLLTTLLENPGRLLTKSELLDRVWPGLVVEEANLHVQVSSLRKLLGPKLIATIPGQGYKLAVALEHAAADSPQAAHDATTAATERPDDRRHNLFESSEALIGREADIEALNRLLDQHRLVTAVGSSGVGKTRLAQAVARQRVARHADGVWWVDLAALRSADHVAPALAKAAGLALGGGAVDKMLALALSRRDTLLVLDNCEHLLDAVAALAVKLLEGAPKLRLLATSLAPLRVQGEQVCRLEGLAVPPSPMSLELARCFAAIQLLEQRAQAVDHRFRLTEDSTGAAIELCRQLDGVALAIEMAAGRLPMLGPAQVLARLGDRLRLLRSSRRQAPERHQTLGATLEWSHSLLAPDEQTVLRRLAVFAGGFRLDTGLAVAAGDGLDESTVLDALCGLVDKSLLHIDGLDPPRYRLLETTRLFAVERLKTSTDAPATTQRFCQAMAELAVEVETSFWTMPDRPWLQRYLADYDNFWLAIAQASEQQAAEWVANLATALAALDSTRADLQNRRKFLHFAATALPSAQGLARAKLLKLFVTTFSTSSGDAGVQRDAASRELVALCRELGDPQRLCDALGRQATVAANARDKATVQLAMTEARSLECADWPVRVRLRLSTVEASLCDQFGDAEGWRRAVHRSLALAEQGGMENAAAYEQMDLADLAMLEGDAQRAVEMGTKAMETMHRLGMTTAWAAAAAYMCSAYTLAGQRQTARELARAALAVLPAADLEGMLLCHVALLCARAGQSSDAARLLGCSQAWHAANHNAPTGSLQRLHDIVAAESEAALGSDEFNRLRESGSSLAGDGPHRLLCALLDTHCV